MTGRCDHKGAHKAEAGLAVDKLVIFSGCGTVAGIPSHFQCFTLWFGAQIKTKRADVGLKRFNESYDEVLSRSIVGII